MRIETYSLHPFTVPLTGPVVFAGEAVSERAGLLVRLVDEDGREGWGEASPLPGFSRESLAVATQAMADLLGRYAGQVVPADAMDPDGGWAQALDARALPPSVRFGLELAVANLMAAGTGRSLAALLAPQPHRWVVLNGLLMGHPMKMLGEAAAMVVAGYEAVKLKVGRRSVREEIRLVRALSEVLGAGVRLRLDANRAWDLDTALAFARGVRDCPIEYIEEPLSDPAGLAAFTSASGMPVALDESLLELTTLSEEQAYARAVVLKPTLLGGLIPSLRLARAAETLGLTVVISSSFETGVGTRGLVALAAAGATVTPAGLDPYRWIRRDVLDPPLALSVPRLDAHALLATPRRIRTGG